jgi:hypothetical protein
MIVHPLDIPADEAAARSLATTGAENVRARWRTDLAIGAIAGPLATDGFSSVYLTLAHAGGIELWERRIELASEEGWSFAATLALDELRRFLER